jgi:hypothetical protein
MSHLIEKITIINEQMKRNPGRLRRKENVSILEEAL